MAETYSPTCSKLKVQLEMLSGFNGRYMIYDLPQMPLEFKMFSTLVHATWNASYYEYRIVQTSVISFNLCCWPFPTSRILSQRFWLRRAGLPAVLGASLDGDPFQHQSEGWLFLESKRSGFAKRLAVKAENGQRFFRAFFGFYSFTEAPWFFVGFHGTFFDWMMLWCESDSKLSLRVRDRYRDFIQSVFCEITSVYLCQADAASRARWGIF